MHQGIIFTGVVHAISAAQLMKISYASGGIQRPTLQKQIWHPPFRHDYVSFHFQHLGPLPLEECFFFCTSGTDTSPIAALSIIFFPLQIRQWLGLWLSSAERVVIFNMNI